MRENKTFHQIFLSDVPGERLPKELQGVVSQNQSFFPDFDRYLWCASDLRDCLATHFSSEILRAYDTLKPLAYKADLARYCLMYLTGGWYADLSLKLLTRINCDQSVNMIYFHDFGLGPPGPSSFLLACQNGLFYAKAKHPILERCIERIVRHCEQKYYGLNSTCPTGPMVFGRSISEFTPDETILPGYFMALTPNHDQKNLAYVDLTGNIIAFHKSVWHPSRPQGGNFEVFGLKGSNNYNRMWVAKDIYND